MLLQNGVEVQDRDYFQEKFTADELRSLSAEVGIAAIFARRSPSLKKMGLDPDDLSEDRMLELMLEEPRLVRRPLIKLGDQLIIGSSVKAIESALAGG